jgi:hypothetical protein
VPYGCYRGAAIGEESRDRPRDGLSAVRYLHAMTNCVPASLEMCIAMNHGRKNANEASEWREQSIQEGREESSLLRINLWTARTCMS